MFKLEFSDLIHKTYEVTSYDEFYDAFDDMVHQHDRLVNMSVDEDDGYGTVIDYGLDEEYRCGCYEFDEQWGFGMLTRLGQKRADYVWVIKEA